MTNRARSKSMIPGQFIRIAVHPDFNPSEYFYARLIHLHDCA